VVPHFETVQALATRKPRHIVARETGKRATPGCCAGAAKEARGGGRGINAEAYNKVESRKKRALSKSAKRRARKKKLRTVSATHARTLKDPGIADPTRMLALPATEEAAEAAEASVAAPTVPP
jgi:hypothetical protein